MKKIMPAPAPGEQEEIHAMIFPKLEEGIVVPEKKKSLLEICVAIIAKEHADWLVLGCTGLPLIVKEGGLPVSMLNTTHDTCRGNRQQAALPGVTPLRVR